MNPIRERLKTLLSVLLLIASFLHPARDVRAAQPLPGIAELRKLYPELSDSQFQEKLTHSTNSYEFLRSFVPLYYVLIHEFPAPEAKGLSPFSGWCVGDAHPENFGVLVSDSGHSYFAMNDQDDGGPCPLYADFLRFWVASDLGAPNAISPSTLLRAYLDGLTGVSRSHAPFVRDLLSRGEGHAEPPRKLLDDPRHLARGIHFALEIEAHPVTEVTEREKAALEEVLHSAYGSNTLLLDALSESKDSGGSAGMSRYLTLIQRGDSDPVLIEFKQIQSPAILPVATSAVPGDFARMMKNVSIEQGSSASTFYTVRSLLGKSFLLRPKHEGDSGVALRKIDSASDLENVLEEEAAELGRLHAKSLTLRRGPSYADAVRASSPEQWKAMADRIAAQVDQVFRNVSSGD